MHAAESLTATETELPLVVEGNRLRGYEDDVWESQTFL